LNEDNTLNLHVTPPLLKHFVMHWPLLRKKGNRPPHLGDQSNWPTE